MPVFSINVGSSLIKELRESKRLNHWVLMEPPRVFNREYTHDYYRQRHLQYISHMETPSRN